VPQRSAVWEKPYGPIDLLIIQASPFCNLDCSYCYLPDRRSKKRIEIATVVAAVRRVIEAGLVHKKFTIVWHAGEPLAVPVQFYENVFAKIAEIAPPDVAIRHTFQTNATLLNERWVELILRFGVRVGISIDGPEFIHDRNRLTISGRGTFEKVMRGIDVLRRSSIDFYTISVLTDYALDFADAIFDFFEAERFTRVGFNLEEAEGAHKKSTLNSEHFSRVRSFFERFYSRYRSSKPHFEVREFAQLEQLILSGSYRSISSGQQLTPLRIVSINSDGGLSTFAPELLTMTEPSGADFVFGNVHDQPLLSTLTNSRFLHVQSEIKKGVDRCAAECAYFAICGGGSPSNKFSETGRFDIAETNHCRLRCQALPEAIISALEKELVLSQTR
jgi:uncharacterized protein